jgi:hypothetical protein
MNPAEVCELYMGHRILVDAYEYLQEQRRINDVSAQLVILDARVEIQEELVARMFEEPKC